MKLKDLFKIEEATNAAINLARKLEKPISDEGKQYKSNVEKFNKDFDRLYNQMIDLVKKAAKTSKTTNPKEILNHPEDVAQVILQDFLDKKK